MTIKQVFYIIYLCTRFILNVYLQQSFSLLIRAWLIQTHKHRAISW